MPKIKLLKEILSMMRNGLFTAFLVFVLNHCLSGQNHFQQQLDYDISAVLNAENNTLEAQVVLDYQNNSPDTLESIIFHVWMNAFSDRRSAFAEQRLRYQMRDFHFADQKDYGGYTHLEFTSDNQTLAYQDYNDVDQTYTDIIVVKLHKPLPPQSSRRIKIDYSLDVPFAFDRPGFKEGLYRMTQWYPKPAVYDHLGWHPMPYLSLGEFYSEYADYEVTLELPISFSMASTGISDENASGINIEKRTRSFRITATNVHDFAWFASEDYIPYKESISIDDNKVDINVLVKEENTQWEQTFTYAKRALAFLSEKISSYPYPQLTIVEGASDEEGGMEYPMITILNFSGDDQQLDHLITHETGHQWFYSVLGSNERDHPWIDEGLSSYFDHLYDDHHYEKSTYDQYYPFLSFLMDDSTKDLQYLASLNLLRNGFDLSIEESAKAHDPFNYLIGNYIKMREAYAFLSAYMGEENFDKAIKRLFKLYAHKHISPQQLQKVFESTVSKDLSWFFVNMIQEDGPVDLALDVKDTVLTIQRNGNIDAPFNLSYFDTQGKFILSSWIESNGESSQEVKSPSTQLGSAYLNDKASLIELSTANNRWSDKRNVFPRVKLKNVLESSEGNTIGILPHVLYNRYDGVMLGASLYSPVFPQSAFRYLVSPSYAFGSSALRGHGLFGKGLVAQFGTRSFEKNHARIFREAVFIF